MKKCPLHLFFLSGMLFAGPLLADPTITISSDRKEAIYACREDAVFTIEAREMGALIKSGTLQVSGHRAGNTPSARRPVGRFIRTEPPEGQETGGQFEKPVHFGRNGETVDCATRRREP